MFGRYALKFISGKYQGYEFPLPLEGELIIGRSTQADLVIVEEMVSRQHSQVTLRGKEIRIKDLGSTNGTFVNGAKVQDVELKLNDRILVGTSIVKVITPSDMETANFSSDNETVRRKMQEIGSRAAPATTMSGELDDVPIPDLLQLFAVNRKSGVLSIEGENQGKIFIKDGALQYAVIGERIGMPAMKAICRMVSWSRGTFHFAPIDTPEEFPETFKEKTESILLEGLRQKDETDRIRHELPSSQVRIHLCLPLTPKLSVLKPAELDVLQVAMNFDTLQAILDETPIADFDALVIVQKLIQAGYVETVE